MTQSIMYSLSKYENLLSSLKYLHKRQEQVCDCNANAGAQGGAEAGGCWSMTGQLAELQVQ